MMDSILNGFTQLVDVVMRPIDRAGAGVLFFALITAVIILTVYKYCSPQAAITRVKNRLQGHFLGIYLFRDNPSEIFNSLFCVITNAGRYMLYSLPPLMVVIIPVGLICIQMQLRYGHRSPEPGERVIVSMRLGPAVDLKRQSPLLRSEGAVAVETAPLRIFSLRETDWRVKAGRAGSGKLIFTIGGAAIDRSLHIGSNIRRLYPRMGKPSFKQSLFSPGSMFIPVNSSIEEIYIGYPSTRIAVAGLHLHWSIIYFATAIVFGILLKRFWGVEF